jgi:hypothetical protein
VGKGALNSCTVFVLSTLGIVLVDVFLTKAREA